MKIKTVSGLLNTFTGHEGGTPQLHREDPALRTLLDLACSSGCSFVSFTM